MPLIDPPSLADSLPTKPLGEVPSCDSSGSATRWLATPLPASSWMENPREVKVTLVICVFNNFHRLPATLESICGQTHLNFECLVLLPEEGTPMLSQLPSWRGRCDLSYQLIDTHSLSEAYNRAAAQAQGHYILFLQAGDILISSYALEKWVTSALENFAPDLVYMGTSLLRGAREPLSYLNHYSLDNLRQAIMPATLASSLIRLDRFLEMGRFDASFKQLFDLEWYCRVFQWEGFQFVGEEFYCVEREPRQVSTRDRLQLLSEQRRILTRYFGHFHSLIAWWAQRPYRLISGWLKFSSVRQIDIHSPTLF